MQLKKNNLIFVDKKPGGFVRVFMFEEETDFKQNKMFSISLYECKVSKLFLFYKEYLVSLDQSDLFFLGGVGGGVSEN